MVKGRGTSNKQEQLTREALADVDAGLVIDHSIVQAWALSLDTDYPLQAPHWETE
ncbi:hypothetical protein [Mesorhizobium sp.]|jgi:hypothetical protein|uniref:hypothetical protein n=1 Tax=Mesorhizobium sp. TaxID=1871066 RepID=UPI00257B3BA2|nr:hypothetical protein [Mesorhizobium sp.]